MRILLVGEYSGVHYNLSVGLKALGHDVTLASGGDSWKNYPRDIDLKRELTFKGRLCFLLRLIKSLPKMRGFDVVQLINPVFIHLKAERIRWIYDYIRKHNRNVVLAVFGDDYYYPALHSKEKLLRFCDFYTDGEDRWSDWAKIVYKEWIGTPKERLNRHIASTCDYIVAGSYEYWLPYYLSGDISKNGKLLKEKLTCIPLPFIIGDEPVKEEHKTIRIFVGLLKDRAKFKGTDVMLKVATDLKEKYPGIVEVISVGGLPYSEYKSVISSSDILLDQIWSYCPGMNALLALSKGIICFSGGEPEHYDIIGENECRPIINVEPSYSGVYQKLEWLILHPELIPELKRQSREYVIRNHDHINVAGQYEALYGNLLSGRSI